jgi:Replication initiator protein A
MKENITVIKRTNQQVRQAIHGFWDGRDEMNLVEFPVALLAERAPTGVYTLEFSDVFSDWQHHRTIQRHVTIAGTPKYGLPTAKDEEVLLGLLQLTKITNEFTSPRVEFSRYQLLELLKWKNEGPSYRRLVKAFDRWLNTSLTYNNAWRDNTRKEWTTRKGFGFLDSYEFRDSRLRGGERPQAELPFRELHSEFRWNSVFFESIQSGYLKKLDYSVVQQLKSPAAKRLYRYLDKLFHEPERVRLVFDLRTLCCEHLAMARTRETSHLRKDLHIAAQELETIGFLEPQPEHKRFHKVGVGVYEVAFEKKASPLTVPTQPALSPPFSDTQRQLYQALIDRQISHDDAVAFLTSPEYPDEWLQEKIEVHDWLIERGDPRISKSAPGYLVMSIRKRYSRPEEFSTRAERLTAQTKAREHEAQRAEQERQRQEREKARYDADVQKVYDYLASLPNDAAREELEQQAVATNRLWREVYYQSQGSDRHEFWRLEILKSYISKLLVHTDGEGEKTS